MGKVVNSSLGGLNGDFGCRLRHFTISFLAIILGFVGYALAFQKAEEILRIPYNFSLYIFYFSVFLFFLIVGIYFVRLFRFPKEVIKELHHPIKLNFFPILAKVLLIASIILVNLSLVSISKFVWIIGAILQFGFSMYIMGVWLRESKFNTNHLNPSWFIPIVGNVIVPIVGVLFFLKEVSWFFFSIGLVWWLVLFIVVINRIIFHNPLPEKLVPTMFILFAPPAVAFIALLKLAGSLTNFGRILYYTALFMFFLIVFQVRLFAKLKFYLSWWAYSFPTVAMTIATLVMFHITKLGVFMYLSWFMFLFLNLIMVVLVVKTIKAIIRRELCVEEKD